jgi:hypothetical protein
MRWADYPNLLRRPARPAAGRGRLHPPRLHRVWGTLTTTAAFDFCYAKHRARGEPIGRGHRWAVHRILHVMAERVGRAPTIGRPWLWAGASPNHFPKRKADHVWTFSTASTRTRPYQHLTRAAWQCLTRLLLECSTLPAVFALGVARARLPAWRWKCRTTAIDCQPLGTRDRN